MSAVFTNAQGQQVNRTKCEIYTRVMGYHRPVSSFNTWKKAEFYSREYFCACDNQKFAKEFA